MDKRCPRHCKFVAIFLVLFAIPTELHATDKIRVGFSAISLSNAPVWVAEEKQFFKKYDLETEAIVVGGGATRSVSAVIAGDLQFGSTGGGAIISAAFSGADLVMVAAGNNKGIQRLMVRPDIANPAALKGKRIGITTLGSSGHLALLLMLRKWGMAQEDVQVVQVGASPVMLISLQKGGIDAAVLQDPSFFMAEDMGYKTLGDPVALDIQYLQNVVVASRSYLKSHHDVASRFMKAFVEGVAYLKRNKEDTLRILMKKMRIEKGKENYLERSYNLYATQYMEAAPYPSLVGTKTVLEFMVKDFPKAKTADPNSFIDNSLIKPLEDSGFIKALYP
ncbi:MAG TPA: ABC transporter substrate-binding protein [Acidobacteriota bacterium]|nr:ABC transporter substrate-binding protein [Acidobacteriota bacterium]